MPHNGGRSQINLSHPQFGGYSPFANLMLDCQLWNRVDNDIALDPSKHDANGYMSTLYGGGVYTVGRRPTNTNRPGSYLLKWTGTGTLQINTAHTAVSGSLANTPGNPGRYIFTFNNDDTNWSVRVVGVGTNGSDYPNYIALCHVDDETIIDANPYAFAPKFIARLNEIKPSTIRMLNAIGGGFHANPWCKWADRKPVTWYSYAGQYTPPSRYAGATTNSGTNFSLASPGFVLENKASLLFTFNADGAEDSSLNIEGTGAIPLIDNFANPQPIPYSSRYPKIGRICRVTYDADFNAYIMNGGGEGTGHGCMSICWPIEIMVALCNEIGSHLSLTVPYLALDPMTDLVEQASIYCRDNLNAGLKLKVEGPNETWNSIFVQTSYADRKEAFQVNGVAGQRHQAYGRWLYQIGEVVETVFGGDRSKYDVVCAVQTFGTPAASNDRLASTRWVANNGGNSAFAAYNKVTEVDVAGYWINSQYGTATEAAAAASFAAAATQEEELEIVDTHMRDASGPNSFTPGLAHAKHLEWKAWVDGFDADIALGQYEGGYSPDLGGDAEINAFRLACKNWPGLHRQTQVNYNRFILAVGGREPSCYRMTGINDAWGVLDPNEWVTDPPQWTAIKDFSNNKLQFLFTTS